MRKLPISTLQSSLFGALLLLLFFCIPETQALTTNNFLDKMVSTYQSKTASWQGTLSNYALNLFWILAGIEVTWSAIRLALRGADISEFLAELLNRVLYIGFFLTLLLNSSAWSTAIVNSFQQAGNSASTAAGGISGISPSNVLDSGWLILQQVVNSMSIMKPGDDIVIALAAIVIMIAFAFTTALLIIALIESYIVISAGVILMGFGGTQFTNQFAINTIRYAVSVGVKLFMVQLIIGLGQSILDDWVTQVQASNLQIDDILMIAAGSIVFLAITKVIPDMVQALINGSSLATGAGLSGMVAQSIASMSALTAAIASGGTSNLAGTAAAGIAGFGMASERLKADPNYQRGSDRSHLMALTGEAIKGSASHLGANLGQRFRGERKHGNLGAQIGHSMKQEAVKLKELREGQGSTNESSSSSQSANKLYAQDKS